MKILVKKVEPDQELESKFGKKYIGTTLTYESNGKEYKRNFPKDLDAEPQVRAMKPGQEYDVMVEGAKWTVGQAAVKKLNDRDHSIRIGQAFNNAIEIALKQGKEGDYQFIANETVNLFNVLNQIHEALGE